MSGMLPRCAVYRSSGPHACATAASGTCGFCADRRKGCGASGDCHVALFVFAGKQRVPVSHARCWLERLRSHGGNSANGSGVPMVGAWVAVPPVCAAPSSEPDAMASRGPSTRGACALRAQVALKGNFHKSYITEQRASSARQRTSLALPACLCRARPDSCAVGWARRRGREAIESASPSASPSARHATARGPCPL